jgi:putative phosphoribosyl transferase
MFENREEAGQRLFWELKKIVKNKDIVVVALARGGAVLGRIIADRFGFALNVVVVKKIGAPGNSELALGAVAPKNTVYWNNKLCRFYKISKAEKLKLRERTEVERIKQEVILKQNGVDFKGKTVILVDDGIATGATAIAALKYLRKEKVKEIILAVPVLSGDTLRVVKLYFDTVIYLFIAEEFNAVGEFYKDFPQVENEQVLKILGKI